MNSIIPIQSENAPAAIGPYSAAVQVGNLIITSGQLPIVPETGKLAEGSMGEIARQSLNNIKALLEAAGSRMEYVVKTTIFMTNLAYFAEVNEAYAAFFGSTPPARSCVQVAALPKGAPIEIEAVALGK